MSLFPTIYSSTDPGAPQLTGQAGSMIALLDAILVNGYGVGNDSKAGMGWTKEFSGANKAVYRNSYLLGTGYHIRFDDSAAQYARWRAYRTMLDVDTGDGMPIPTDSQLSGGGMWPKSAVAGAVARSWWAIGNAKVFYLFVDASGMGESTQYPLIAGDGFSIRPGDNHCFLVSQPDVNTTYSNAGSVATYLFGGGRQFELGNGGSRCVYVARSAVQSPGGVMLTHIAERGLASNGAAGASGIYPCPVNNGLVYSPIWMLESANSPRCRLPGVYAPAHAQPFADKQFVADISGFPVGVGFVAKSFRWMYNSTSALYQGQVLFEVGREWE